jgi:endonuclease G
VRRLLTRLLAAAAVAAGLLGGSGCGLDRLFGGDSGSHGDEPRHVRHRVRHPKPSRADDHPAPGGEDRPAQAPPQQAPPQQAPPQQAPPQQAPPQQAPPGAQSIHLALGTPTDADPSDDYLMIKPQYALSYNPKRLGANWVSWELNASWFGGEPRHKGKFLPDESLPAGWYRVRHEDYLNSDYDRGHMVRSEERTRSRADNESTFLLTNVLPQRHDLNAGPWLRLEDYCQQLAKNGRKEMFITAGPIYGANPPTIGHGIAVPEAFFKIVVVLDRGQGPADVSPSTRVIAVVMPNVTGILDEPWGKYRTSIASIERLSGYHFLGNVPEETRRVLENRVDAGPTG